MVLISPWSIKIQLNLSETEKKYIRLFKKRGFKEEAVLKDHYRIGEHMHIFAKVIGNWIFLFETDQVFWGKSPL